jgi:hypothetical protein
MLEPLSDAEDGLPSDEWRYMLLASLLVIFIQVSTVCVLFLFSILRYASRDIVGFPVES